MPLAQKRFILWFAEDWLETPCWKWKSNPLISMAVCPVQVSSGFVALVSATHIFDNTCWGQDLCACCFQKHFLGGWTTEKVTITAKIGGAYRFALLLTCLHLHLHVDNSWCYVCVLTVAGVAATARTLFMGISLCWHWVSVYNDWSASVDNSCWRACAQLWWQCHRRSERCGPCGSPSLPASWCQCLWWRLCDSFSFWTVTKPVSFVKMS